MSVKFYKYQGTGNDFIIIDNRKPLFPKENVQLISYLCNRKFGIGADGLLLLDSKDGYDFEMVYFNSDGKPSSMCGNGGRCIVAFAKKMGIVKQQYLFNAVDGSHESLIVSSDEAAQVNFVSLKMNEVSKIEINPDHYVLNTGSPHYVKFVQNLAALNVYEEARKIRFSEKYKEEGINVNFVENLNGNIFIRTYERGVENETLSCGTGMTAAAICASLKGFLGTYNYCRIMSYGGETSVRFKRTGDNLFYDIWLEGPATFVFEGEINV